MYKMYGNLHVKLFYIKNCFTCSHVSDFWWVLLPSEIFIEFGLPLRPRETDWWSGPGFDEVLLVRWKLVIGDLKVCVQFFFKNVAIYWSCGWKLVMLDLTQNWFEIVFQAFDFSSQKNRLVMIEWNLSVFIILWRDHICW